MTTWADAINYALPKFANAKGTAAASPKLTNQEASGLIIFAREVAQYAAQQGSPIAFDWYGFALPALGWRKSGDRFVMSATQQQATYPTSDALWMALKDIAAKLDAARVPFKLVRDPAGTEGSYKSLASSAWVTMQAEHPADAAASARNKITPLPSKKPTPAATSPDVITSASSPDDEAETSAKRKPAPKDESSGDGAGGILLLALVVYALTDD